MEQTQISAQQGVFVRAKALRTTPCAPTECYGGRGSSSTSGIVNVLYLVVRVEGLRVVLGVGDRRVGHGMQICLPVSRLHARHGALPVQAYGLAALHNHAARRREATEVGHGRTQVHSMYVCGRMFVWCGWVHGCARRCPAHPALPMASACLSCHHVPSIHTRHQYLRALLAAMLKSGGNLKSASTTPMISGLAGGLLGVAARARSSVCGGEVVQGGAWHGPP